jgi:hypothetical protein
VHTAAACEGRCGRIVCTALHNVGCKTYTHTSCDSAEQHLLVYQTCRTVPAPHSTEVTPALAFHDIPMLLAKALSLSPPLTPPPPNTHTDSLPKLPVLVAFGL